MHLSVFWFGQQCRYCEGCSESQYVSVQVQGAPTSGVIDTGADIPIMGDELFKKVAAAKCDFK